MRRATKLFALALLLAPATSHAVQLHWSNARDTLSFASATRCTLTIQADAPEQRLPSEWTLVWVADSVSLQPTALGPEEACSGQIAQPSAVDPPSTAADSLDHRSTAHLCSGDGTVGAATRYLLDLPGGARAKLKVVALDPSDPDSMRTIESNEATCNGGVDDGYPPVVLHASSIHQSLLLQVTVVGSGLNATNAMNILAPDSSWTLPLTVIAKTDAAVTGIASVAALLPACEASVSSEGGGASIASLEADEEQPMGPESCGLTYAENLLPPPPPPNPHTQAIQPKDLAWVRGFVDASSSKFALHLFYIRRSLYVIPDDANEKNIGHVWTTDLNVWQPDQADTVAISTTGRNDKFDALHVFAPTTVQRGPVFHMFYTGVRIDGTLRNQRIGVATSTDLIHWTQENDPVLTSPKVDWARQNPAAIGYPGQQLRDPFVMPDPINYGKWLMYFVALDSATSVMAVGVARSPDLRTWTAFPKPFSGTERPTSLGVPTSVESPHVFRRNGNWWMPYTVNGEKVVFETTASSDPADTVTINIDPPQHPGWTNPVSLFDVVEGPLPELRWWHSTEYLQMQPNVEYLAAWRDSTDGNIDIKGIYRTTAVGDSMALSCPAVSVVDEGEEPPQQVAMSIPSHAWRSPETTIRLELPAAMVIRLTVHDIAGRRRTTLLDGEARKGISEVVWDGRDERGLRLASGVYFVRLVYPTGARVSKIIMLR